MYRAWRAEETAARRMRRPKPAKLATYPRLRREVERRLAERWSPQQIAARLMCDYPEDPEMRVSHETIYRSLFVQARGALRKELVACLRTGRAQRRSHKRTDLSGTGRLQNMIMISRCLLLRPAQPMAARQQREHQWFASSVLPERCGPQHLHTRRSRRGGQTAQLSPSTNAGMDETLRDVQPRCCVDHVRAPSLW